MNIMEIGLYTTLFSLIFGSLFIVIQMKKTTIGFLIVAILGLLCMFFGLVYTVATSEITLYEALEMERQAEEQKYDNTEELIANNLSENNNVKIIESDNDFIEHFAGEQTAKERISLDESEVTYKVRSDQGMYIVDIMYEDEVKPSIIASNEIKER